MQMIYIYCDVWTWIGYRFDFGGGMGGATAGLPLIGGGEQGKKTEKWGGNHGVELWHSDVPLSRQQTSNWIPRLLEYLKSMNSPWVIHFRRDCFLEKLNEKPGEIPVTEAFQTNKSVLHPFHCINNFTCVSSHPAGNLLFLGASIFPHHPHNRQHNVA